jgi:hypothetical protein
MSSSIEVPEVWLRSLLELAEKVSYQIDAAEASDHLVFMKTDISSLVGQARSANVLLKPGDR